MNNDGIILQGAPGYRNKLDISGKLMWLLFMILPTLLLIGAIVMLFIHVGRIQGNILVKAVCLVVDVFKTRTGWLFKNGETYASVYKKHALEYAFRMIGASLVLFCGGILLFKVKCPYCKHYFTLSRISEDQYAGSTEREVSNTYDEYSSGYTMDLHGDVKYIGLRSRKRQYGTEITEHFLHNARCSCCGCVAKRSTTNTYTNWE